MKKLSALLALALSVNICAVPAFAADEGEDTAVDSSVVASFDFEDLAESELPDGLTEKVGYTNVKYATVDDAHGNSVKLGEKSGFHFAIPETAGDTYTVSFDFMQAARGGAKFNLIGDNDGTADATATNVLFNLNGNNLDLLEHWVAPKREFTAGKWYKVDVVIKNTPATSKSTANIYIDGVRAVGDLTEKNNTLEYGMLFNELTFMSENDNLVYIDNLNVKSGEKLSQGDKVKVAFDFNTGVNDAKYNGTSSYYGDAKSATLPVGANVLRNTNGADTWDNSNVVYQTVDKDHGLSLLTREEVRWAVGIPEAQQNKQTKISFEINSSEANTDGFYIKTDREHQSDWAAKNTLVFVYNNSMRFGYWEARKPMTSNTWYKLDFILKPKEDGKVNVDAYMNGEKVSTYTVEQKLTELTFWGKGDTPTYIDNLSIETNFAASTFTATNATSNGSKVDPELNPNSIKVRFSETIDQATVPNDDAEFVVTDSKGQTLTTSYTEWNDGRTQLVVYTEEDFDFNETYTLALPETLKSVFGDALATTDIAISTYPSPIEQWFDFNDNELPDEVKLIKTDVGVSDGELVTVSENDTWSQTGFGFVHELTDGVVKISYDQKLELNPNYWSFARQDFNDANHPDGFKGEGFYWTANKVAAENMSTSIKSNLNWNATDWTNVDFTKWHHYDLIFDFENSTFKAYMDGVDAGSVTDAYAATKLTHMWFKTDGKGKSYVDNIYVSYYDAAKGSFATDIDREFDNSREYITVTFKDAVDATTIENIMLVDSNGDLVDTFECVDDFSNVAYASSATFAIGQTLTKGEAYTLDLSEATTILGGAYENPKVTFTAEEVFRATDAKILDGTTALKYASSWNAEKEYTVSVDFENTLGDENTVYAIVAGYNANQMTNTAIAPLTVKDGGNYTANLAATDMKGATQIKVYVFNSLKDLAPLMVPAVQIK